MIEGTVPAQPAKDRIETMKVGATGYIWDGDITVTRTALYIDRLVPILTEADIHDDFDDDPDSEKDDDVIKITRVGAGLTENDFVLDFTNYKGELCIEGTAADIEMGKELSLYVVFKEFTFRAIESNDSDATAAQGYANMSIQDLQSLLEKAMNDEDYVSAKVISDEIAERKKQKA